MVAIAAVFGGLGALIAAEQATLRRAALAFVLPDDWITAADHLLRGWMRDHRPAMINLLVSALVVVVPALTFPLKEKLSARYEAQRRRGDPDWQPPREPPLWVQALEEALLLLVFAALALGALRVALTPGWGRVGHWLSNGVLAFTFAVDFIGPTLARHRTSPTAIYRVLFRHHPLAALGFGALLSAPPLLVARLLARGDGTAAEFALLAGVNTACVVVAALWGTAIGSRIASRRHPPPTGWFSVPFWSAIGVGLALNLLFFGGAFRAALGVSPVLKCDWRPVPDTFDLDLPGLLDPTLRLSLDVDVHNPTERTARVDENTVEIRHRGRPVAETRLPPFTVPAGETARQHIALEVTPSGALWDKAGQVIADGIDDGWWPAVKGAALGAADPAAWAVVLTLPLPTGELVVPLYDGARAPR